MAYQRTRLAYLLQSGSIHRRSVWWVASLILLAVLVLSGSAGQPVLASETREYGLVVVFDDQTIDYHVIEVNQHEAINGLDLLREAEYEITVSGFGSLGEGLCAVDRTGCGPDDCYCESFGSTVLFWRYARITDEGTIQVLPVGPSSRTLKPGDIDVWFWEPTPPDLNIASLEQLRELTEPTAKPATTATIETEETAESYKATPQITEPGENPRVTPTPGSANENLDDTGDETSEGFNPAFLIFALGVSGVIVAFLIKHRGRT